MSWELYLGGFLIVFVTTAILLGFYGSSGSLRWDPSDDAMASIAIAIAWPIMLPIGALAGALWFLIATHAAISELVRRRR